MAASAPTSKKQRRVMDELIEPLGKITVWSGMTKADGVDMLVNHRVANALVGHGLAQREGRHLTITSEGRELWREVRLGPLVMP